MNETNEILIVDRPPYHFGRRSDKWDRYEAHWKALRATLENGKAIQFRIAEGKNETGKEISAAQTRVRRERLNAFVRTQVRTQTEGGKIMIMWLEPKREAEEIG